MTLLVYAIIALLDSAVLPVHGLITSIVSLGVIILGVWKSLSSKGWFILSLLFITLASVLYFIGNNPGDDQLIKKLSDWSLIFLILGSYRLAVFARKKHASKNH